LEKARQTWEITGSLSQNIIVDKRKAWESVQQKIKQEENNAEVHKPKIVDFKWILRIAAVLGIGLLASWFILKTNSKEKEIIVQTTNQKKTVSLPDGSTVFLNEYSSFTYPEIFSETERKVKLSGEAFFEVAKNAQQPFLIENALFEIKVVGTSFDVNAYPKNKDVTVTVVTGTVVFKNNAGKQVELTKEEQGILDNEKQTINESLNSDPNFMAWKINKLEFKNAPFADVCSALQEYFSIEIDVKDTALYNCRYTGVFEKPTLQEVLTILENTLNLKAAINKKQISFSGKGC
jgi:transmembrane sensor